VDLGVPADKITVLRNGVDLELFRPVERDRARSQLQFTRTTLLSVGHLIERKGHHIAIEAMVDLPDADLVIVGDGQMEGALRALAQARGVSARVRFVGPVPQDRLKEYYSAADALVLASSREGWANVLLESMACGTPVIATRIWGTPEVVQVAEAGVLMTDRTPQALTMAFRRLFAAYPDRGQTRRYAERFSWDETTEGQLSVFRSVVADKRRTRDEEGTGPTP
jgi:glycosyltransferase involved in cell wall biosynthesis